MMPKNEKNAKKPINFHRICSNLISKRIITGAVVCRSNGDIVYMSSNWNVEASDLKQCLKKWQEQEQWQPVFEIDKLVNKDQFITLQGRKYSILRFTDEYFLGANLKDESFLMGARSPHKLEDDRYYLIGYAPPGTNDGNSCAFVIQAAKQMKEGTPYHPLSGVFQCIATFPHLKEPPKRKRTPKPKGNPRNLYL